MVTISSLSLIFFWDNLIILPFVSSFTAPTLPKEAICYINSKLTESESSRIRVNIFPSYKENTLQNFPEMAFLKCGFPSPNYVTREIGICLCLEPLILFWGIFKHVTLLSDSAQCSTWEKWYKTDAGNLKVESHLL